MFRRTVDGVILEFGNTGVLRFTNLVMYDRLTESWWQEFNGEAIVGDMTGQKLEFLPMAMVSWEEFKESYPDGKVLSRPAVYDRPYGKNPFVTYDTRGNEFFSNIADRRLSPMQRVVGMEFNGEALAIPYTVLKELRVVQTTLSGQDFVVFFTENAVSVLDTSDIVKGRVVGSATVFDSRIDREKLTFMFQDNQFVDEQTGTTWNILGIAESGPLTGTQLEPLAHHSAQFWFSWVTFKPNTEIYSP